MQRPFLPRFALLGAIIFPLAQGPAFAQPKSYEVDYTATLSSDGRTIELAPAGPERRMVSIEITDAGEELVIGGDISIRLARLRDGLAQVDWPALPGLSLSRADVVALSGTGSPRAVRAWKADIAFPVLGPATLVLYELGPERFGGLLSSRQPGAKRLRQMVFQPPGSRQRARVQQETGCSEC